MNVPFPLFPARFFPSLVFCQKQSVVLVTHPNPLLSKSVHSLPSSSLPPVPCPLSLLTIMFLPSFPIDDHVPALFPYWRLCPRPLSLLAIMFPLPFPIFDYVPSPFPYFRLCPWHSLSLMSLCYFYKIVGSAIYVLSIWVSRPDNYYSCTILCSKFPHYFNARALLKDGCSSPLK
jgi:hypothetical protein